MMSKNCHNCWLLDREYTSRYGFLYRCEHNVALTTKELQKNCSNSLMMGEKKTI